MSRNSTSHFCDDETKLTNTFRMYFNFHQILFSNLLLNKISFLCTILLTVYYGIYKQAIVHQFCFLPTVTNLHPTMLRIFFNFAWDFAWNFFSVLPSDLISPVSHLRKQQTQKHQCLGILWRCELICNEVLSFTELLAIVFVNRF